MANLRVHVADALNDEAAKFAEMNVNQMLDSLRSDNKVITPEYTPKTAKRKGFEFPNLFDTGDFQGDVFFISDGVDYFLTSGDWKTPLLIDKYTDKIFGIPDQRIPQAQQIALSSLARIYNQEVLNG